MKNLLRWILLALSSAALNIAQAAPQIMPLPEQSQAAHLSAEVLTRYHYKHTSLDDALSSKILDNYLKALDGEKVYFLQADIDNFANARTSLDDAILKGDLSIPFAIFNTYQQRIAERLAFARSLLNKGFDFKKEESYQFYRRNAPWEKSTVEMNDLWRKRVKNDWLRLKLTGDDDKSIINILDKRYENSLNNLSKVKSNDVFQYFMDSYAMAIDPHTNYFGKRASDNFDISMTLSLTGIGAVLQEIDEYTTIRELVAGGPAALSGKLKVGDRIVGVGQGEDGPINEVIGWRIDDAVALIRGAEDSVVRLDVLPAEAGPDAKPELISLVRKKISLEKQAAKKSIIEVKDDNVTRRIGVITLPGFYQDFTARQNGDKNFRSATRDVSHLLDELKQDKVESVLIDLRNNSGGSLNEAIELTGLFIGKGPIVQQRDSTGKITVENDSNTDLAWNGPMGVLINRASASASEIFAAAIQDYGRGIVIGEPSFGKGTVQSVINLDRIAKNETPKFGEVKVTVSQFFRINGGTTQLRGVTPDISLPTMTDTEDYGESSFDNALPWTQIEATDYSPEGNLTGVVPILITEHDMRVSKDKDFQYLREDIAEFNAQRNKHQISLNEAVRRKEREAHEARVRLRENDKTANAKDNAGVEPKVYVFQDDGLQPNERNIKADLAIEKEEKNADDVLLNESAHILSDEIGLLEANPKLAASILPKSDVH